LIYPLVSVKMAHIADPRDADIDAAIAASIADAKRMEEEEKQIAAILAESKREADEAARIAAEVKAIEDAVAANVDNDLVAAIEESKLEAQIAEAIRESERMAEEEAKKASRAYDLDSSDDDDELVKTVRFGPTGLIFVGESSDDDEDEEDDESVKAVQIGSAIPIFVDNSSNDEDIKHEGMLPAGQAVELSFEEQLEFAMAVSAADAPDVKHDVKHADEHELRQTRLKSLLEVVEVQYRMHDDVYTILLGFEDKSAVVNGCWLLPPAESADAHWKNFSNSEIVAGNKCFLVTLFMMNAPFFYDRRIKSPLQLLQMLKKAGVAMPADDECFTSETILPVAKHLKIAVQVITDSDVYSVEMINGSEKYALLNVMLRLAEEHYTYV
jgi:hypothetical protein